MEIARLFIGLPLPEEHRRLLTSLLSDLKPLASGSCSWTRPENWHLTLRFLGDTPLDRLDSIKHALSLVDWEPFAFRPGGGGFFPGPDRPRVVWVGVADGGAACRSLAHKVDQSLAGIGFDPEPRFFAAHLTVARVKATRRGDDWSRLLAVLLRREWPITVMDRFVLWRSYLGGTPGGLPGPRYVPLGEYGAAGGTA